MGKDVVNLYFKAFQRTVSQTCRTILPASEPRDRYSDRRVFSAQKEMQECGNHWPFESGASLVAQLVNNLPAMWETWVQSLGWGDPLEESLAAHFKYPYVENPHGQRSRGAATKSQTQWSDFHFISLHQKVALALQNWFTWNFEFSSDVETLLRSQYWVVGSQWGWVLGDQRVCVLSLEQKRRGNALEYSEELLSPSWEEPLISQPSSHPQEYPQCVRKEEREFFYFIILWAPQTSYKSTANANF